MAPIDTLDRWIWFFADISGVGGPIGSGTWFLERGRQDLSIDTNNMPVSGLDDQQGPERRETKIFFKIFAFGFLEVQGEGRSKFCFHILIELGKLNKNIDT